MKTVFARFNLISSRINFMRFVIVVLTCTQTLSSYGVTAPPDLPECKTLTKIPNKAMNCPDQFAWEVFVKINQRLGDGETPIWHSFATDGETFPSKPVPSVCNTSKASAKYCPTWPNSQRAIPISQQRPSKRSHLSINKHLTAYLTNVEVVQRNVSANKSAHID